MKITSKSVSVKTRRINAKWSREMSVDLSSFHSFDWETEMEMILVKEMRVLERKKKLEKILSKI